jgi:hypothetical protein
VITWCSILRVGWGGGAIREGAQQRPGSKAARSSASVNFSAEEASSWLEKSQWGPRVARCAQMVV